VLLNEQANLKNLNENSCDGIKTLAITALPLVIKIGTAKGNYNTTVKPSITVKKLRHSARWCFCWVSQLSRLCWVPLCWMSWRLL